MAERRRSQLTLCAERRPGRPSMWIVKIALQRPYTFIVLAILILLMGVFAILRTATDIFPSINIPVISVIWTYTGLVPSEMETRIVSIFERECSARQVSLRATGVLCRQPSPRAAIP